VVTSTVTVTVADTFLHDVNLTTNLTHTFAADLDITLMSPAGTIVTLTTDNGAGNDNVFNGTVWDDNANPAGQVPYVTNNGLVTDHAYVNLTTATPLVPEEAMAAFRGENPNGTWTITISDDLAGDGGSLDSWSLDLTTLSSAPTETTAAFTQSTPTAIPTGPAVVTSTVVVSGAGTFVTKITLLTNMPHTFAADLDVTLASPAGTVVTLTTDNGAGNDDVFNGTLWDDDANPGGQVPYVTNNGVTTDHAYVNLTLASPLVPEEAMGAFVGEDPNGTWTVTISDDLAGDGGSLDSWTLNVTTGSCAAACTLTCPANITVSNDPNQCGAVVNYPPPTTSAGCGTVTCTPPSGSFFPVGTTTVTCTDSPSASTCSFTVTVNDTQPPAITCPTDVTAVGGMGGTVVTFSPPTATDNCPGVTAACVPPSGSTFPPGSTTVTCTATDATGNTATCSFSVVVFDVCIQDSSNPGKVLLINSMTGEYRLCCGTTTVAGIGKVTVKAGIVTLEHNAPDRRVLGKASLGKGSGSLQMPPGTTICTIADNTAGNGTCACAAPAPPPPAPPAG
jgi:subtilisin-like proprotein convertase family protein